MDRTCPVENCTLINRAMKLLYTSIGALDIKSRSGADRSIFISSFPFSIIFVTFSNLITPDVIFHREKLHSPTKLL